MMLTDFILLVALVSIPSVYGAAFNYGEACVKNTDTCDAASAPNMECDPANCVCVTGKYRKADAVAATGCSDPEVAGAACTDITGQCASGTTCQTQGDDTTKKCTADNTLYGGCTAGSCATVSATTVCGTAGTCECASGAYAKAAETTCPNTRKIAGATCDGDGVLECVDGYKCLEDAVTKAKTCTESGAGFIQASLFMVVITALASVWSRG